MSKNSINVYWSLYPTDHSSSGQRRILDLVALPFSPVITDLKKKFTTPQELDYLKCPAFVNNFKNTFVFKSPVDFEIDFDPITMESNIDPDSSVVYSRMRDKISKIVDVHPYLIFFSEGSLEMSTFQSSLHWNDFTENTSFFPGKFDIGKWFRPLQCVVKTQNPKIKIKRGDALFYVRFHTTKKINLIHYNYHLSDLKLTTYMRSCLDLKFQYPGLGFKQIYNFFIRNRYNKRILEEIKKNITDLK